MKHVFTLTMTALLLSFSAFGQTDVKLDFSDFLAGNYRLSCERAINPEVGLELGAMYITNKLDDDRFTGFNVIPEMHFYFNPVKGIDGFFVGPYFKFRRLVSDTFSYPSVDGSTLLNGDVTHTGLSFGLVTGKKWTTNAGFIFGINGGFGRFLVNDYQYESIEQEIAFNGLADGGLSEFDFRLMVNVGWRFNSKKID